MKTVEIKSQWDRFIGATTPFSIFLAAFMVFSALVLAGFCSCGLGFRLGNPRPLFPDTGDYSERRKSNSSCCCVAVRALKLATTPLASEPQELVLAAGEKAILDPVV